jgi:hypothetical protein
MLVKDKFLKFSLPLFALLWGNVVQAQPMHLLVHSPDGTEQSFALSNIHTITFSEGNMNVLPKNGTVVDFAFSAIYQLTFAEQAAADIPLPAVSALKLYPNPVRDELLVTGDTEIETIAVFGISGTVVLRTNVQSSTARLSLGFLPKGIYLIQVKRADSIDTQKIIKL